MKVYHCLLILVLLIFLNCEKGVINDNIIENFDNQIPINLPAQTGFWRHTNSPSSCHLTFLDTYADDFVFACAQYGAGLYISDDNGKNWYVFNKDVNSPVTSIDVSPIGDIFVATQQNELFKYDNIAMKWTKCTTLPGGVSRVVVNKRGYIFAAGALIYRSSDGGKTWVEGKNTDLAVSSFGTNSLGHIYAGSYDGFLKSIDNGDTWVQLQLASGSFIRRIEFNSKNHIFALAGISDVFRSNDGGNSWFKISQDLNYPIIDVVIDSNDRIYVSTGDGIYLSENDAESWQILRPGSAEELAINENDVLFASVDLSLYVSYDLGNSWDSLNLPAAQVYAMAIDTSDRVYAFPDDKGLYYTDDHGNSYSKVSDFSSDNLYITSTGTMFSSDWNGTLLRSLDHGAIWENMPFSVDWINLRISEASNQDLYLGVGNTLYTSSDNGDNWSQLNAFSDGISYILVNDSGYIFIARGHIINKSTDKGLSFTESVLADVVTCMMMNSKGYLFACTPPSGLYRSKDNGNSWVRIHDWSTETILVAPNDAIFMQSQSGIHVSTDDGDTWKIYESNLYTPIFKMICDSQGYIFAATTSQGILVSAKPEGL